MPTPAGFIKEGISRPAAGVDGCRGGWCVVTTNHPAFVCATFVEVLKTCPEGPIYLDMPIGLPRPGQSRPCDTLARQQLGRRACSVFSAPAREWLGQPFKALRGVSLQAWNLFARIAEVDAVMTPQLQTRVREAHPELVWRVRLGHPPVHSKRSPEGRAERLALLPDPAGEPPPRGASRHDLVDAWGLWLAACDGKGYFLGGQLDERGLRMEIGC